MKLSKKYVKRIKKRILGCISSIAVCLVLIAGCNLAGLSTPISNLKNFSAKSNVDETKRINNIDSQENSVGAGPVSARK